MKPIESIFQQKPHWYCSAQAEKWLLLSSDILALLLAFLLAARAVYGLPAAPGSDAWWATLELVRVQAYMLLACITVAVFWYKGHYSKRMPYSNESREVLKIALMMGLCDVALVFFAKWDYSRAALLLSWSLAPCLILLFRFCTKRLLIKAGGWIKPMVIIGWGENALETALAFKGERLMGYTLTAFLVPRERGELQHDMLDRFGKRVPCIPFDASPETLLSQMGNPHIVMALEQGGIEDYRPIIEQLGRQSNNIQIVPSVRGLPLYGMEVNHFFAHEVLLLTVRNNLARRFPQLVKRLFDLTASIAIIVLGSPVLLWIALRVMASGRPIFFGHQRVGQHKQSFACYKFRTMAPNAEELLRDLLARDPEAKAEWERDFKLKNDPRITPIGNFLRKTSLDELPQLWNVLKGDMSLVGPRPVVTAELERYGNQCHYYFEAKPGVTGLWQVSGRNDVSYDTRVYLDAWYVKNWSLFTDIVILLRTVKVLLRRDGAY